MGKFINTNYTDTIDSLVNSFKQKLDNPYYMHSDKKATIVTYYKQNIEASTLDEALQIAENQLGDNSPIRYNKINNFYLYGISTIETQLEDTDFGIASSTIEGEAIILPHTIIPIPGDYFEINYLENPYIFKILEVTQDTLENGNNLFKLQYKYDKSTNEIIMKQVIQDYDMIVNNVGTDYKVIIKSSEKDYIINLENMLETLKKYYKYLFYNDRVETFIFRHLDANFYDPYVIEFIIRNKLMDGSGEFMNVQHQVSLPTTFPIDYNNSFFRSIELRDKETMNKVLWANGTLVSQPLSTLYMRKEDYFMLKHTDVPSTPLDNTIDIFPLELFDSILYGYTTSHPSLNNLIVKYFNKEVFTGTDIDYFDDFDYLPSIELFYYIPILILAIEGFIKDILKGTLRVPRVDIGIEPEVVTYGVVVVKSFSDAIYAYFVGELSNNTWVINRYNKNNEMKHAITTTEPLILEDCQILSYTTPE